MTKSDRITAVIVAIAVTLLSIVMLCMRRQPGTIAVVRVDNRTVLTIDLTAGTSQDFRVQGVLGPVRIRTDGRGSVRVVEATCPDQICVHTKAAHNAGDQIICAPNHLALTVEGGRNDVDALAQ